MELDAPVIRSGAPAPSAETSLEVPPVLIVSCSTQALSSTPARSGYQPGCSPVPAQMWLVKSYFQWRIGKGWQG